jgi:hypothetical protein
MGLCSVILGFALGAVQPMVMSMLHQITPHARHGEALGLRLMTINASSVAMPMLFGSLGALIGIAGVFWVVGGVLALLAGLAIAAAVAEHVRIRVSVLAVAVLLTGGLLYQFTRERVRIPPPAPEVTYISTFEPGRTDAEIAASNLANQKKQDRLKAEQAQREEEVKDAYRALGRATGLDVDAMEREIARDNMQQPKAGKPAEAPVAD